MPILSNPRHERFAQELAKGKSATQAYVEAGYEGDRTAASRLSTNVNVQKRVAELQRPAVIEAEITVASLLAEAEEARLLAMESGQPAAAITAIKEKGVLSGLRVEKRENTHRSLEGMTDDELLAIARGDAPTGAAGREAQLH